MAEYTVDTLQIEVEDVSKNSTENIDKLVESLQAMKNVVKGSGSGFSALAKRLNELKEATEGLASSSKKLGNLATVLKSLSDARNISLPKSLPERLKQIGEAVETITPEARQNLDDMTRSLQRLSNVDLSGFSAAIKVATGGGAKISSGSGTFPIVDASGGTNISGGTFDVEPMRNASNTLEKSFTAVGNKINEIAETYGNLVTEVASSENIFIKTTSVLKQAFASVAPEVSTAIGAIGTAFTIVKGIIDEIKKKIKETRKELDETKSIWTTFSEENVTDKAKNALATLMVIFPRLGKDVKTFRYALNSLLGPAKEIKNVFVDMVKKIDFKKIGKSILNGLTSPLKNLSKTISSNIKSNIISPFEKAFSKLKTLGRSIARIAFYRAVRTAIKLVTDSFKEGIDNLYQYSKLVNTSFAPSMDKLATSAQYLKNSLGAMAAPLIEAVAPAVDYLIDKFVALLNIIGKVFAALTGKSTYTQAKKQATEYADAANDAAAATKKFLLGIDELTILDDSSSGNGTGTDYSSMFEEVEVPSDISDFAAEIKKAIENGDWYGAGKILAEKLNGLIDQWDSYSWGKTLGEKINNALDAAYGFLKNFNFEGLGVKLADFFNGLFDGVDFEQLGKTLAAKWNALVNLVYGFVTEAWETGLWSKIGQGIADAINGWFEEIDWAKLGQTITLAITGLFETLETAIKGIHWAAIGEDIAELLNNIGWEDIFNELANVLAALLNGLFDGIIAFVGSYNWGQIGSAIGNAIKTLFDEFDTKDASEAINRLMRGLFCEAQTLLETIPWPEIGQKVATFLNDLNWPGFFMELAKTLADALNGVFEALATFVEGSDGESGFDFKRVGMAIGMGINKFISEFDWVTFFTGAADLAIGLMDGISTALEEVDWDEAWSQIKNGLDDVDWASLVESAAQLIVAAFKAKLELKTLKVKTFLDIGANIVAGILEGIGEKLSSGGGIGAWLSEHLIDPIVNWVKNLFGIHSPSTVFAEIGENLIDGLLNGISDTWGSITGFFGEKLSGIKETVQGKWDEIKENTSEKWETIKSNVGDTWEGIKTTASNKFKDIKDKITGTWDDTDSDTSKEWSGISSSLGTTWESVKKTASDKFESVKSEIGDAWNDTSSDSDTKWNNIKKHLSDAWVDVNDTAKKKFGDVKNSITDIWDQIVTNATSWGSDICKNIAKGINNAISSVTSAASNIASKISSFLHFSEPDIGPLSDFHTYMPDMLETMAKGIRSNAYLAVNAVSDLAGNMKNALDLSDQDGLVVSAKESFTLKRDESDNPNPYGRQQSAAESFSADMEASNENVVSAIYAMATQIISAINANSGDVYLDGVKVGSRTTDVQNRQNRMYGKTLQNA
jgi:hypothetical protein